jgi:DUF4097 and DUF4098 domain-containing protein YvlB
MFRRTLIIFTLAAIMSGQAAIAKDPAGVSACAQKEKGKDKASSKDSLKVSSKKTLKHELKAELNQKLMTEIQVPPSAQEQTGRASLTVERGGKIVVGTLQGRIIITGAQGNTIEAKATSSDGTGSVPLRVGRDESRSRVTLSVPSNSDALLEIKVPRYMEVEVVGGHREADVEVSDIDAPVNIGGGNGNVTASRVGPLRVSRASGDITASNVKGDLLARTASGDLMADNIEGMTDVVAASGDVVVRNTQGNVRVHSASGDINVHCVKGRADLNTASGDVDIVGIGGDIDANTTSGDVDFRGRLRSGARYVLKSLSGEVKMVIQPDPPGFTATLMSYDREIETAFSLKLDSSPTARGVNRSFTGRYGDGQVQIQLSSFSGGVRILKGPTEPAAECK